jgi:2-polyprenyl-6-methoxyphenol hydroxylase-like FAD-dependent oxidoreductase
VTFDIMVVGSGFRGAVTGCCLAEAGCMPTLPYKFRSTGRLLKNSLNEGHVSLLELPRF